MFSCSLSLISLYITTTILLLSLDTVAVNVSSTTISTIMKLCVATPYAGISDSTFKRFIPRVSKEAHTFLVSREYHCRKDMHVLMNVHYKQALLYCLGRYPCFIKRDERCEMRRPTSEKYWKARITRFINKSTTSRIAARAVRKAKNCTTKQSKVVDILWKNLKRNVISRQYYTKRYKLPAVPLGPRADFLERWNESLVPTGKRKYLFNFAGSFQDYRKADRELMRSGVQQFNWTAPIYWQEFDYFVEYPEKPIREKYLEVLHNSTFTLCPVGNGDDTFRFWESIVAGTIPVTSLRQNFRKEFYCQNQTADFFLTAPVVWLDNWTQVDRLLSITQDEIQSMRKKLHDWYNEIQINMTADIVRSVALHSKKINSSECD